jgi:enamine deaminase RidA (YjgF/YER057c/UK114 family)
MTEVVEQGEHGNGMDLRHHSPAGIRQPFGRYHHVVEVEGARRLLFLSGQLGVRPDGSVPEDVAGQAEQVFANIDACLAAAGCERRHLLRLAVYLTEAEYRLDYMRVRDAWVANPAPASTLIVVKALALPSCKVEVEAVAAA